MFAFCHQVIDHNVELALVSTILRHANLDATQLYAKPSIAMIREAMCSTEVPDKK